MTKHCNLLKLTTINVSILSPLNYPFTAPIVKPLISSLENETTTIIIGIIDIASPKYIAPSWFSYCLAILEISIGIVYLSVEFNNVSGVIRSFHSLINTKIDIVAIYGIASGIIILLKIYISPAPSIKPDSIKESGILDSI